MANTSGCVDPAVSVAFKALAYESDLIQGYGEYMIRSSSAEIKEMIPQEPGNPNEGCDPIEHVEYSFWATDCDYQSVDHCADNGTQNIQVPDCQGGTTALEVNANTATAGAPGLCDPPTCILQAGHNIYRGVEYTRACESPVICLHELIRAKHVRPYLEGLRAAFPREMDRAHCHKLWELLIQYGTNLAELGPGCLDTVVGTYDHVPTGTIDYGTLLQHQEMLLAQGYPGKPVYYIGHAALRQMVVNHKNNTNLTLNSAKLFANDAEINAVPGGMYEYGDIRFKILEVPIRGYFVQIGAGAFEFRRIENRQFVAGTGAGAVVEYDSSYQKCKYTCDEGVFDIVELIGFAHPMAFRRRPYAAPQMGFGENLNGAFNMETKVIGGAHISCNPDEDKYKLRAKHHFRFVPKNPRWGGTIAHLYTPYQRFLNEVTCEECPGGAAETITVRPFNTGECEDPCCYDADESGPPVETAGEFYFACALTVAQGETQLTVCVERRNGTNGVATLQADTANGTATAGVDYTAVVAEALAWADGEGGVKCFTVPGIVQPAAGGDLTFDIVYSLAVGASIGSTCTADTATVTIQQLP